MNKQMLKRTCAGVLASAVLLSTGVLAMTTASAADNEIKNDYDGEAVSTYTVEHDATGYFEFSMTAQISDTTPLTMTFSNYTAGNSQLVASFTNGKQQEVTLDESEESVPAYGYDLMTSGGNNSQADGFLGFKEAGSENVLTTEKAMTIPAGEDEKETTKVFDTFTTGMERPGQHTATVTVHISEEPSAR